MTSPHPALQLRYAIANAPLQSYPFPHMYVRNVFPADFYRRLREHIPPREHFRTLTSLKRVFGAYPESRLVLPIAPEPVSELEEPYRSFWKETGKWLLSDDLLDFMLDIFEPLMPNASKSGLEGYRHEALLVQDYSTYKLDPHTDSPRKVLSVLFYLPPDESLSHLGTAIYVPKDRNAVSDGSSHLPREDFECVCTMPFVPNSMFAFVRTPKSFHGVEPIAEHEPRRDLLLYDVRLHA